MEEGGKNTIYNVLSWGGGEKTTIRPQGKHNLNTQITL